MRPHRRARMRRQHATRELERAEQRSAARPPSTRRDRAPRAAGRRPAAVRDQHVDALEAARSPSRAVRQRSSARPDPRSPAGTGTPVADSISRAVASSAPPPRAQSTSEAPRPPARAPPRDPATRDAAATSATLPARPRSHFSVPWSKPCSRSRGPSWRTDCCCSSSKYLQDTTSSSRLVLPHDCSARP